VVLVSFITALDFSVSAVCDFLFVGQCTALVSWCCCRNVEVNYFILFYFIQLRRIWRAAHRIGI
jgi:hypothetical protein